MDFASEAERTAVLQKLPQQPPFRFVDRILELSPERIVAEYRFRLDEYFYPCHFPGDPVTPGVILIESMAQVGLVSLGIYLLGKENPTAQSPTMRTLFSECAIEFFEVVRPGELVTITGERIFWRRNKLKSNVIMKSEQGATISSGVVAGIGVVL